LMVPNSPLIAVISSSVSCLVLTVGLGIVAL
jgi:hypothetical protein